MSSPGRFLQRWSRLKRSEATGERPPQADVAPAQAVPAAQLVRADSDAGPTPVATVDAALALPPVESLDLSSDFTAFLKDEVSESLRRAALKKLFGDPVFNAMDGLDIYIDDYSIPDPIAPDVMKRLKQFETFLADPVAEAEADKGAGEARAGVEAPAGADTATTSPDGVGDPGGALQHVVQIGPGDMGDQLASAENPDTLSGGGQNVPLASEIAKRGQ